MANRKPRRQQRIHQAFEQLEDRWALAADLELTVAVNGQEYQYPGPSLLIGEMVTWDYQVTNVGNRQGTGLAIRDFAGTSDESDDFFPQPVMNGAHNLGDINQNSAIDPGETWHFSASENVQAGRYNFYAVATISEGASDSSAGGVYEGKPGRIAIVPYLNGNDATQFPEQRLRAGTQLDWQYQITNPGVFPLAHVVVTDDAGTPENSSDDFAALYLGGDENLNQLLDPSEVWTYAALTTAAPNANAHITRVEAVPVGPSGERFDLPTEQISVAYYYGVQASFELELSGNGDPADSEPGFDVPWKDTIQWQYTVTNTGNVPLKDLSIIDDGGTWWTTDDDRELVDDLGHATPMGTLMATFNGIKAQKFVLHPTLPYLYATDSATNGLAIINTETLKLEANVFVGSGPWGLTISDDGTQVYVANRQSNFVAVFDTRSRTVVRNLQMPDLPRDIEVGAAGQLYVLTSKGIHQIDPNTGATFGPDVTGSSDARYGAFMEISPDKSRLYMADSGLSPASLYQYDVSKSPAVQLWESDHGQTSGSNGQDLGISHDGTFISYAAGSGQIGYSIAKYRTSDMAILGTFNTGAYPNEITFSPDDKTAFTVNTTGKIGVWDTTTFISKGTINTSGQATELIVDQSGNYVFAAFDGVLRAYHTGKPTPPNPGDLNSNYTLDPGETWQYFSVGIAAEGQQEQIATATANDIFGVPVSTADSAHYFGTTTLEVLANVSGQVLAGFTFVSFIFPGQPPQPPTVLTVSDNRFEMVDGGLRLKEGIQLSPTEDTGLVLEIKADGTVFAKFVLQVYDDASIWHNLAVHEDVNNDGRVSPQDILLLVNEINWRGMRTLYSRTVQETVPFIDVNGDCRLSPQDILLIVDRLNRQAMVEQGFLSSTIDSSETLSALSTEATRELIATGLNSGTLTLAHAATLDLTGVTLPTLVQEPSAATLSRDRYFEGLCLPESVQESLHRAFSILEDSFSRVLEVLEDTPAYDSLLEILAGDHMSLLHKWT